ncbi:MAG: VWA domain-containing protein [Gammaproteobacteria bacterium]|nr:MAG: VWA domain-containing protein [Gammaproteobacteria bacterium]
MKSYSRFLTTTLTAAYLSMAGTAALGDDTEIFFNNSQQLVKPNVMLILDVSGSMGTDDVVVDAAAGTTETRLAAMKRAAKDLVNSLTDVKVGLMIFGGDEGAYFKAPIADVSTQRTALINKIDGLWDGGNTPLSESLFEAMRYYQGGNVFIRSIDEDGSQVAGIVDSSDSTKFDSPIEYSCQSNYALVLTDGAPTSDTNHETTIESVVGTCSGNCLDEIADYMWTEDMIPAAVDPNDDFPGQQKVATYTIGFKTNQTLLSDTASKGGGQYLLANDSSQLATALKQVFDDVNARSTTYVAPGIAVNSFDRLNHLDTLYYALFESDKGAIWNGNLKRYKLDIQTNAQTGKDEAVIVDVNGNAAIDQATGFFKDNAKSWWSPVVDGPNVAKGGAASKLPDTTSTRKVFSNLNSRKSDLSDNSNSVVANNNNLTKADFGDSTMTDAEFSKLISWTRGVDVNDEDGDNDTTDARKLLADPLHSVPQLVVYSGTTVANQDTTIYYGDNQGYIHAIDGDDGSSYFSFIPRELLAKQPAMMNSTSTSAKEYGMDGTVVSWSYDDDYDGALTGNNDFVYIYSGMRRGGRSYYALDVTDRTAPSLLWRITGGVSGNAFEEMGQTWSTPVKTKIAIGNSNYDVLIFGGGYDPDQDNATVRTADDEGRAVYIVDATNGNLLWWAGPTGSGANMEMADMDYSIPASPKVLDVNGDGLADQIYVGDMGGQIFRFDISNTAKLTDLVTGGRIADFGGSTTASNRRFYHSPDLFGIKLGGVRYLGLIIGSGFQAHPLNKDVDDRIYMMKISAVSSAPLDPTDATQTTVLYKSLTESDLYDATDNLIQQGTSTEKTAAASALATADGWFIKLDNNPGEKVLSESVTVNNEVFITTYEPKASSDPCRPPTGTSRLYHISVLDGSAVRNYYTSDGKGDDELTRPDRYVELDVPLPSNPQRMRVDDTDVICVGTDCQTIKSIKGVVETYWYED